MSQVSTTLVLFIVISIFSQNVQDPLGETRVQRPHLSGGSTFYFREIIIYKTEITSQPIWSYTTYMTDYMRKKG